MSQTPTETTPTETTPTETTAAPFSNGAPVAITVTVLDTLLGHLAPHFLASAGGDLPTVRHAASCLLAAYDAETEEELHLATDIVSFGFHALAALSQAAAPGLALTKVLRLRGSAVSLSRETHKARRKLDQLRKSRLIAARQAQVAPPECVHQNPPPTDPPLPSAADSLTELTRHAAADSIRPPIPPVAVPKAWTTAGRQRHAAQLITENLRRNKLEAQRHATHNAPIPSATIPPAAISPAAISGMSAPVAGA